VIIAGIDGESLVTLDDEDLDQRGFKSLAAEKQVIFKKRLLARKQHNKRRFRKERPKGDQK